MPEFKIYYKKGEDPISLSYQEDTLIEDIFKKFSIEVKKDLKDLVFYYKGSQIKYGNSEKINKSIFKAGDKDFNIFAVSLTTIFSTKVEEKEEDSEDEKNPEGDTEKEKKERLKVDRAKYNDIICPYCKTSAIIDKRDNTNYGLKILNCKNFHYGQEIPYDEYENYVVDFVLMDKENEMQKEKETNDEKKEIEKEKEEKFKENRKKYNNMIEMFKCQKCSNTKEQLFYPYDKFFICSCGVVMCNTCHILHESEGKAHHMIDIDDINYFCIKHGKKFESYCIDCNDNICKDCQNQNIHSNHEIKGFMDKDIKVKKPEIEKLSSEMEKQKKILLDFITKVRKELEDKLKIIEDYANNYIKIENTLIKRFESYFWNYQLLRNLKNKSLFQNEIVNELKKNLNSKFKDKIETINNICSDIQNSQNIKNYKKVSSHNYVLANQGKQNSMDITYKINNNPIDRKVRLFDEVFVENNKDLLSVSVNGVAGPLTVYYMNNNNKKELNVKLEEKKGKKITNMSYMFNNCKNLDNVDFKNWNTYNIFSMEATFQLCSFDKINFIKDFNMQNVENIRAMFCKCINLKDIPDFDKWFKKKEFHLTNISMLFSGCKSLTKVTLPKWENINKIEDISYLFNRCTKLQNINLNDVLYYPEKIINASGLFNNCKNLKEISLNFKSKSIEDISFMFQNCENLEIINELKFKDSKSIKYMNGVFAGCSKLKDFQAIKNWNTESVKEMIGMFKDCKNLGTIYDLSNCNMSNVYNVSKMFFNCVNLKISQIKNEFRFNPNFDLIQTKTFFGCNEKSIDKIKKGFEKFSKSKNKIN